MPPLDRLPDAARALLDAGAVTASNYFLQKRLSVGGETAAALLAELEARGALGPAKGGPRPITDRAALLRLSQAATDQVRITGPNGEPLFTGTTDQFFAAADAMARKDRPPMKDDPDFRKHNQTAYAVTADELRQFIERFEQLEAEKKDLSGDQKDLMAEAKGRGYDTKVMRKIIALRRRKPDELAEEEAVLDLYKSALGMA